MLENPTYALLKIRKAFYIYINLLPKNGEFSKLLVAKRNNTIFRIGLNNLCDGL